MTVLSTRGRSVSSCTRCSQRCAFSPLPLALVVADRNSLLYSQLLPFTEESGDPIETRLRKRQMESVDYSPFVQLGISVMGQSASLERSCMGLTRV